MATYRLWLIIKDSTGNEKDIDCGTVNIDLTKLTDSEATIVARTLAIDTYATDQEVTEAVSNNTAIKYSDFELKEES